MKTLSALLFVALTSVTAACGKLPGGLKIPGAGSVPTPTTSGGHAATTVETAAETIGPERKVDPKLVAYYQQQDLQALHDLLLNSARDDIYEKAKADVGRDLLWQSGNPDPTWIKVWNTKDWSYASGNAETLMQASFNRSWEAACKAEFAKTRAAHTKLAETFAPELTAVDAIGNHYARRAAYAALAARYEAAATSAGLDVRKDPFGPSGFRIAILQHAIAYHQGSRQSYASFPWSDFPLVREMQARGRAFTDDAAFEQQAYCGRAASGGGLGIPSFGSLWGGGHASERNVAWPTVWGDDEAVETRVKALAADAGKALTARDGLRIAVLDDVGGLSFATEEPKLTSISDVVVDSVAPAGGGVKLTLSRKRSSSYDYACKETRKIDRIDDDGRIIYRRVCKTGERSVTLKATASFDELPPGVTLAKGDILSFTADVEKDDSKKVKDTAPRVDWVRTTTLTGRILTSASRSGKPVY